MKNSPVICPVCRKPIVGFANGWKIVGKPRTLRMIHVSCYVREELEEIEEGRDLTKEIIDKDNLPF